MESKFIDSHMKRRRSIHVFYRDNSMKFVASCFFFKVWFLLYMKSRTNMLMPYKVSYKGLWFQTHFTQILKI